MLNGKIYIGVHKTKNPNDDYMGSGKLFKRAVRKYGVENFKKEVLYVFDNAVKMFAKEKEIVNTLFVESNNTYNLLEGGCGGFSHINNTGKNVYGQNGDVTHGGSNLKTGDQVKSFLQKNGRWEQLKKNISDGMKEKFNRDGFHWTGRKHNDETKRKIGIKMSVAQSGVKNSQYGTCWIHHTQTKKNLKVKKEELQTYLTDGYSKGRVCN